MSSPARQSRLGEHYRTTRSGSHGWSASPGKASNLSSVSAAAPPLSVVSSDSVNIDPELDNAPLSVVKDAVLASIPSTYKRKYRRRSYPRRNTRFGAMSTTTARIPTTTTIRLGGGGGGGYRKRRYKRARRGIRVPKDTLWKTLVRDADTLKKYGATPRKANAEQRLNRLTDKVLGYGPYYPMNAATAGRGGYWGDWIGRKVGGMLGMGDSLAAAGSALGDRFQSAIGLGGYEVNDIVNDGMGSGFNVPHFGQGVEGGIIIRHKEYLGEMYGPTNAATFTNKTFNLNPGLEATFPWLSQIAANFDEYTLIQCIITFRSTVADFAAASGQVGQIIMATQYNVNAPPFTDKQAMMEYDASMSSKTSESMVHGVECDPAKLSGAPGKYVRTNALLSMQDLKDYDHGVTNVAVSNIPSTYQNQSLGELWISYTVELRKPRFYSARGGAISRDLFLGTPIGACTLEYPFANYLRATANSIGCSIYSPLSGKFVIKFPPAYSGFIEVTGAVRSASAGLTPFQDEVGTILYGNILAIADMKKDAATSTAMISTPSGGALTFIYHAFVAASTAGTENELVIAIQQCWNPFGPKNDVTAELDIHEYNAFSFNNSTGKPSWVDNAGNAVTVN